MAEPREDRTRAHSALQHIFDGRDPADNSGNIMVTLEHVVSAALLVVMQGDHNNAISMLNEGLVVGVERRIAMHQNRMRRRAND